MDPVPYLLRPHALKAQPPDVAAVGQKGRGLAELLAFHTRVPRFCVISASAFDAHIGDSRVREVVAAARNEDNPDPLFCASTAEILVSAVTRLSLPPAVDAAIEEMLESFQPGERLAVRASPVLDEERPGAYAGAFETFLYVAGKEALVEAIKRVFASAFGERAAKAALAVGDLPFRTPMAVVVQRMVDADKSGVAHSIDPEGRVGDPERYVIHANLGVAGGMARSPSTRDTLRIRRDERADVERTVRKKTERVRFDNERGQGTRILPVADEAEQLAPALDTYQTEKVVGELVRLEAALGGNVIVEFAFSGQLLHVLQLTPQFLPEKRIAGRRARQFDERLLPDGWAGLCEPVTFGIFHSAYLPALEQAIRLLGADERSLRGRHKARGRLLGYVAGRTFAHVGAHRAFLDALGEGVLLGEGLERVTGAQGLAPTTREAPPDNDADAFLRLVRHEKSVLAHVDDSVQSCTEALATIQAAAETETDPDDIADRLDELASVLITALTSDLAASILQAGLFRAAERMSDAWLPDDRTGVMFDLMGGDAPAQPAHRWNVETLVEEVKRTTVVAALFEKEENDNDLLERLDGLSAAEPFNDALRAVCAQHQDTRLFSPAKLEIPALAERPDVVLWRLRVALARSVDPTAAERADGLRKKAEHLTAEALPDRRMRLFRHSRKKVFGQTLSALRHVTAAAERVSPVLHTLYGVMRRLVQRAGDRLFEHQIIGRPEDVFTLTFNEVRGLIRGTVVDTDAAQTVAQRRRTRREYPAYTPEAMTAVGVMAAYQFDARDAPNEGGDSRYGERFAAGVSSGNAIAPVFILPQAPYAAVDGRDPVQPPTKKCVWVMHQLDSGLCAHLDAVAGVIAERGSALSVAAQACRRAGIPCIINAVGARDFLSSHKLVEVDGRSGRYVRYETEAQAYEDTSEFGHPDDFTKNAAPSDPTVKALAAPGPVPAAVSEAPEHDLDSDATEAFDYDEFRR